MTRDEHDLDQRTLRGHAATKDTLRLALLLSFVGGFLDAFTYVGHGGVFANAQTGNVVLLAVDAAAGEFSAAVRHVLPILAFALGVCVAQTFEHPRLRRYVPWPARASLVLEIVALLLIGALPGLFSSTVLILVVAFVAAVQNAAFRSLGPWSVNTTMTTGNLRTAVIAGYRGVTARDSGARRQAVAFGSVAAAFLLGAGAGALVTQWAPSRAALAAAALLMVGLLMFIVDEHRVLRSRTG